MVGGDEGLEKQGALVGTEAGGEHEGAVVVPEPVDVACLVAAPGVVLLVAGDDAATSPSDAVHVGGGGVAGQLDQWCLGGRRGDAGDGPHLGVAQLGGREGVADQRQFGEAVGDSQVRAGGHQAQPAPPAQPLGARPGALVPPALPPVELGYQQQPLAHGGRQVGGQLADLVLEFLKRDFGRSDIDGGGVDGGDHGGTSSSGPGRSSSLSNVCLSLKRSMIACSPGDHRSAEGEEPLDTAVAMARWGLVSGGCR